MPSALVTCYESEIKKFSNLIFEQNICIYTHIESRSIIKLLKKNNWEHIRTTGDHFHFRHPEKRGIVTVPHPKKDLPIGTVKSIERQAGIKLIK